VQTQPDGVTVRCAIPIPSVPLGVMTIENLALSSSVSLPLVDGKPAAVQFALSQRDNPFQISVSIFARGLLKALQTRVFLAPLDEIKGDPLARAIGDTTRLRTLIAARDPRDPKIYRWDVRLRGAGEAVFIEL